ALRLAPCSPGRGSGHGCPSPRRAGGPPPPRSQPPKRDFASPRVLIITTPPMSRTGVSLDLTFYGGDSSRRFNGSNPASSSAEEETSPSASLGSPGRSASPPLVLPGGPRPSP